MYFPPKGIKQDALRRWKQFDRAFFGHGACHILAGVFLARPENAAFKAYWIQPLNGLSGYHIYVSDGKIVFDYHGYSLENQLLVHYTRGWQEKHPEWCCDVELVNFDLLDKGQLNDRKMIGPTQYYRDPLPRAHEFINRFQNKRKQLIHNWT